MISFFQSNMHASFSYDGQRGRTEYGVRRSDVLGQSHPGLDDPLVLHNALTAAVDDGQVGPRTRVGTCQQIIISDVIYSFRSLSYFLICLLEILRCNK